MTGRDTVLRGNWATLLLPIAADEGIDFARLAEEIDLLVAARVDGIYSNGTAGELHNQTEAEYAAIQALLAEKCRAGGTPFVIGACQPDPSLARERVKLARDLGASAIQVVLPDWWPVTEPEALDFLQLMAEAAGEVPLILYNPPHAKRVLAPDELGRLVRAVPAVAGIKLADGDDAWYAAAKQHLSGTALFVPGHHLATGMRHGVAAGAFSNVACLSPAGAQAWTDRMAGDIDGALDLERRICRFMDEHVVPFRSLHGYSNAALDKLLAAVGGWGPVGTRLRRPYRWIDEAEAQRLRPVARSMMPELFPG
ncbi:dihydrodipicolinate synthase family protein [Mycobacterium sp. KBS0706]|uniref:dihydrodipicolinate synthase family protein n=1 Tax=Mycobacterium sp. KBS0706 TaxID=2578109 RepID=UPI00110FAD53|nr:dihydrodipicolinate synthase family protein [Mycobacterium sp. KBS0706]TSD90489.1 dihydrodipicolinate synthase family protein [Mycobacterium sp. KBS0706]